MNIRKAYEKSLSFNKNCLISGDFYEENFMLDFCNYTFVFCGL